MINDWPLMKNISVQAMLLAKRRPESDLHKQRRKKYRRPVRRNFQTVATGWWVSRSGNPQLKKAEKRHSGGRQLPPPADNKQGLEKNDGIFHSSLRKGISSAIVAKNLDLCILYIHLARNLEENWMNLVSPACLASSRC